MSEKPDDLLTPDEVCQKLGITQKLSLIHI